MFYLTPKILPNFSIFALSVIDLHKFVLLCTHSKDVYSRHLNKAFFLLVVSSLQKNRFIVFKIFVS